MDAPAKIGDGLVNLERAAAVLSLSGSHRDGAPSGAALASRSRLANFAARQALSRTSSCFYNRHREKRLISCSRHSRDARRTASIRLTWPALPLRWPGLQRWPTLCAGSREGMTSPVVSEEPLAWFLSPLP